MAQAPSGYAKASAKEAQLRQQVGGACALVLALAACSAPAPAGAPRPSAPGASGQSPRSGPSLGPIQLPSPLAPGQGPTAPQGSPDAPQPSAASSPLLAPGQASPAPLALASLAPGPILPSAPKAPGPFSGSFGAGIVSNHSGGLSGTNGPPAGNCGGPCPEPSPTPLPTPQATWAPEVRQAFSASLIAFRSSALVEAASKPQSVVASAAQSSHPFALQKVEVGAFQAQSNGFLVAFPEGTASHALVGRFSPVAVTLTRRDGKAEVGLRGGLWVLAELWGDGLSYPKLRVAERQVRYEGQPLGASALELYGPEGQRVWRRDFPVGASLPPEPTQAGPHQLKLLGPLPSLAYGVAIWPGLVVAQAPNEAGAFVSSSPFDWSPKGQDLQVQAFASSERIASSAVLLHTHHLAP